MRKILHSIENIEIILTRKTQNINFKNKILKKTCFICDYKIKINCENIKFIFFFFFSYSMY